MPLRSFSCAERSGPDQAWRAEPLTFGPVNLLVGKNATGKTRILTALAQVAELLTGGGLPAQECEWRLELENGEAAGYELALAEGRVARERFWRGSQTFLSRSEEGHGRIFAEKLGQEFEFQSPAESIAAISKRDLLQHSFLEVLHEWAAGVDYVSFGANGQRGAGTASMGRILDRFQRGLARFGGEFPEQVRRDMTALGYPVEGIRITHSSQSGEPMMLVKESRLRAPIPLGALSQGMLRSLGLVLFIHAVTTVPGPACVLIDDLGEGLDFDRVCRAVEWLLNRARQSGFQLIFSTNDRFIMNKVPLEQWSILEQDGEVTKVINYFNSRERFDEFKFTGLSNFDFFSMDFTEQEEE